MTPDTTFPDLIRRAGTGDHDARGELFARYERAVRLAVRRRMPGRLRAEFDSLDFVQDVWASFLALPADRLTFDTPGGLATFLAQMAHFKLVNAAEKRVNTEAREARRPPPGTQTPSQIVIAAERWDELLAAVPPGHRAVLVQLRDGRTHAEIAAELGIPLRTIERVVRRLKDLCEQDG